MMAPMTPHRSTSELRPTRERTGSEPGPHQERIATEPGHGMRLAPKRPPGRSTRKARAFAAEIGRLRAQGHTLEAIREALAEAGVQVSKSTVRREVTRHAHAPRPSAVGCAAGPAGRPPKPALTPAPIEPPAAVDRTPARTEARRGKAIAEAFVRDRITNPLLRTRSRNESRRH